MGFAFVAFAAVLPFAAYILIRRLGGSFAILGQFPAVIWMLATGFLLGALVGVTVHPAEQVGLAVTIWIATLMLAGFALFAQLWLREFTGLMSLSDTAFPGRHDKLIWAAVMIALPPLGLPAFRAFRRSFWPCEEKPASDRMVQEMG